MAFDALAAPPGAIQPLPAQNGPSPEIAYRHRFGCAVYALLCKLQTLSGVAPTTVDQIVVDTMRCLVHRGAFVPRQAASMTSEVLAAVSATALRRRALTFWL